MDIRETNPLERGWHLSALSEFPPVSRNNSFINEDVFNIMQRNLR